MWPLTTILFAIFYCATCMASFMNPIWGVVCYIVVYQTEPTSTWWGKPLAESGIRFSLVAAVFTVIGMITARSRLPRIDFRLTPWHGGLIALFLIAAIHFFGGTSTSPAAQAEFIKLGKMFLFAFILMRIAASWRNLRLITWTLVAGCFYIAFYAHQASPDAYLRGRLEFVGATDFATTSGAGVFMAAMLPFIGVAFLTANRLLPRLFALVVGALTIDTIIMCRTRSAFVGIIAGLVIAVFAIPRIRRFRVHAMIALGLLAAVALTDNYFWDRIDTLTSQEALETDVSTVNRREIWAAAAQMFQDHPLGIGVGNFRDMVGDYDPRHAGRATHNTLVVCFVELGLIGGLVFLAMIAASIRYAWQSMRLASQTSDPLRSMYVAYGSLISVVVYFVSSLGTERFYCESFWWVLAIPVAIRHVVFSEVGVSTSSAQSPETVTTIYSALANEF